MIQFVEEKLHRKKICTFNTRLEAGKWYEKCVEVIKLANDILRTFPLRLDNALENMTYENVPLVVFDFIILCKAMLKNLKVELELLKRFRKENAICFIVLSSFFEKKSCTQFPNYE